MAIEDDIEFKIARLQLEPDDFLVIKSKERLPSEVVARINEVVQRLIGHRKCLVLDRGLDLAVLSSPAEILLPVPATMPDEALLGKTDDELHQLLLHGQISMNQMRRAQAAAAVQGH